MTVVSSPIPDLVARLESMPPRIVLGAVKTIKRIAAAEVRRDVGGDGRLSNAGRRGARLSTRDDWKPGRDFATIRAVPPGPWTWVNKGTGPHLIGAGRANRRSGNYAAIRFRKGRRKVLIVGGDFVTGPVFHPGTKGKGTWRRVKAKAPAAVYKAGQDELKKFTHG